MNTTTHTQNNTTIPPNSIPFDQGLYFDSGANENIMRMRWEAHSFVRQLWKNLAHRDVKELEDGRAYLVPMQGAGKPPLNDYGAAEIINIILSVVNPVVSLSNTSEEQALTLFNHTKRAVRRALVLNETAYSCENRTSKENVLQIVENIVLTQLLRSVKGHESRQTRLNLLERQDTGMFNQTMSTGGINWPWGKKKREGGMYP